MGHSDGPLPVQTGLSRVVADPALIAPVPTGLVTNYTAVTSDLLRAPDALGDAGVRLDVMFAPEHGYWGAIQAGEDVGDESDDRTGLPIIDTYKVEGAALDDLVRASGVHQLLVDLQDIGTRFYTYTWTLYDLLCTAARTGVRLVVLDRPNPLGGQVRTGPGLDPAYSSFIGRVSIPLEHGLTLGELGRWFNQVHVPHITGGAADFDVVQVQHWDRSRVAAAQLPWVMPSPNMPTPTTALLYPATGLLEGTVLSEGRGTTRPFELLGAGWVTSELAGALNTLNLPGVAFREAVFTPTFSKCAGEVVRGVQVHLLDPHAFDPIRTGIEVLRTIAGMHPEEQIWREAAPGRPPFIDLLWGSAALREGIDAGANTEAILAASPPAPEPPTDTLLYP